MGIPTFTITSTSGERVDKTIQALLEYARSTQQYRLARAIYVLKPPKWVRCNIWIGRGPGGSYVGTIGAPEFDMHKGRFMNEPD